MQDVIPYYKKPGLTPLQALYQLKKEQPELDNQSLTYAGRLDPMAEGVLIFLKGSAIAEKERFLGLDKEYIATILFGIETDSLDALGIPRLNLALTPQIDTETLKNILKSMIGEIELELPVYSSPPVEGKPLFEWAQQGRLNEIQIPKRKVNILSAEILNTGCVSSIELLDDIVKRISVVQGDFRQVEILDTWGKLFKNKDYSFPTVTIKISCVGGTYIRSLAGELGKRLNTTSMLYKLLRTKVGEYLVD